MDLIQKMQWRYATKRMTGEKVPVANIENILETIRLSPSSMGLQPYTVLVIENSDLLKQISPIANNQPQIMECSHLLVFAAWSNISPQQVNEYIEDLAHKRGLTIESLTNYKNRLLEIITENTAEQNFNWAARQVYLAFGIGLVAAANEGVDATPMEGFNNDALDKLLKLNEQGLRSVTLMPLGYRNVESDWLLKLRKVRKEKSELFKFL
jgi:nitroreductase/dihydropteridine reductase